MTYKLSKKAGEDLENIWLYTLKNWSLEQADYYINLLLTEFKHLAEYPKSGKDFSHLRKDYYRSKVKLHYLFYKINYKIDEIIIVRILHERMDIKRKF